jgi:hypothetical protein
MLPRRARQHGREATRRFRDVQLRGIRRHRQCPHVEPRLLPRLLEPAQVDVVIDREGEGQDLVELGTTAP